MATHISLLFTDAELSSTRSRRRLPTGGRPDVQLRERRHRHVDERLVDHHGLRRRRPGRSRWRSRRRCTTSRVDLTKQIARDGEGAHSLIEVHVDAARDVAQAKRVAKAIVNSPLVKTAVHGGDPNWGRVAMAIGKCSDDTDIDQDARRDPLRRHRGVPTPARRRRPGRPCRPTCAAPTCASTCRSATGDADATVWGCDLSDDYVRFNADYTT